VDFKAFISGCAGTALSDAERRFFAETRPCGLILFARNCETPEQIGSLIAGFKDAVESGEVLVMIDQEGGGRRRAVTAISIGRIPRWRSARRRPAPD
jgi:beta-N-acetylhexosaminidase